MSTYELDDELVRSICDIPQYHLTSDLLLLRSALRSQVPPQLPTKRGAVVETEDGFFVRLRDQADEEEDGNRAWQSLIDREDYSTEDLGTGVKVHFEGVAP